MGIIKAAIGAVGGTLADQWLEVVEPEKMDNSTFLTCGIRVNRTNSRDTNIKGTADLISNGSVIHVPQNTFMILTDGGKIISITDEAGYYKVDNALAPSFFESPKESENDQKEGIIKRTIKSTLKESWNRFKFGGTTPSKQKVYYINKQEIPNIRFGTKNPVSYTDRVLVPGRVVPCKVTSFGSYSLKINDPILFFNEVASKTGNENFTVDNLGEQYLNEFLMAYTTALSKLSTENILVSDIPIKTMELGKYMADVLDQDWLEKRGILIHSVGIAGINFDEKTNELLDKYANDSILFDANARAARMTGSIAEGLKAAGSNEGGAMLGFAGMTMGINNAAAMGVMPNQQASSQQVTQNQPTSVKVWNCSCGNTMPEDSSFCSKCGVKKEVQNINNKWDCSCGNSKLDANFCPKCGNKKPESSKWNCSCGNENLELFCSKCGNKKS